MGTEHAGCWAGRVGVGVQGCWGPWAPPWSTSQGQHLDLELDPLPSLSRLHPQEHPSPSLAREDHSLWGRNYKRDQFWFRRLVFTSWYLKRRHSGCWDCLLDVLGGPQAEPRLPLLFRQSQVWPLGPGGLCERGTVSGFSEKPS